MPQLSPGDVTSLEPISNPLRLLERSVVPMRSDHLNPFALQFLIEVVAVVGFVANQFLRLFFDHIEIKGQSVERDLMVIAECVVTAGGRPLRSTIPVIFTPFSACGSMCH